MSAGSQKFLGREIRIADWGGWHIQCEYAPSFPCFIERMGTLQSQGLNSFTGNRAHVIVVKQLSNAKATSDRSIVTPTGGLWEVLSAGLRDTAYMKMEVCSVPRDIHYAGP